MASFSCAKKTYQLLSLGAKLRKPNLESRVCSFKSGGRRCQVCLNVTEKETITSTSTNQTYKINHEFNCNENFLIYLLTY